MYLTSFFLNFLILGALKAADPGTAEAPAKNCGGGKGIVSATNGPTTTVCSKYWKNIAYSSCLIHVCIFAGKSVPFRLEFITDAYELSEDSTEGTTALTTDGAKVQFFQTSCWII